MTTTLDTTTRETISEAEYRTYPDFETLQIALTRDGHWDMDSGWSAASSTDCPTASPGSNIAPMMRPNIFLFPIPTPWMERVITHKPLVMEEI